MRRQLYRARAELEALRMREGVWMRSRELPGTLFVAKPDCSVIVSERLVREHAPSSGPWPNSELQQVIATRPPSEWDCPGRACARQVNANSRVRKRKRQDTGAAMLRAVPDFHR